MEIVNIEARTFEEMMERFESFVQKVEKLCSENNSNRMSKWLDSQDVCQIMDIKEVNVICRPYEITWWTRIYARWNENSTTSLMDVEAYDPKYKKKGGGEWMIRFSNNSGLITRSSQQIVKFFNALDRMLEGVEQIASLNRPFLNGERYLSKKEVSGFKCKSSYFARLPKWGQNFLL